MKNKDDFFCGVLAALGVVYSADEETTAEEIVRMAGGYSLLRVAKKNQDCYLPNLRKTVRTINRKWLSPTK